jgi:fucose permease
MLQRPAVDLVCRGDLEEIMATLFLMLIYITFISLGLPDSLLGAVWPVMRLDLGAPLDAAGLIFIITSGGTIISSLSSGLVVGRFGAGRVTAVSVTLTAAALLGASFSRSVGWLVLMAVPLGLGAGAVDAALNNYVALHYAARHMSWLHCFWGVGALTGPIIIGSFLRRGSNWRGPYFLLGIMQFAVALVLLLSQPLWKAYGNGISLKDGEETRGEKAGDGEPGGTGGPGDPSGPGRPAGEAGTIPAEPVKKRNLLGIPGVIPALFTFFIYCATEYTLGLWGASFLAEFRGFSKSGAAFAVSMYYMGITAGRFLTGFLTFRFSGAGLIRAGLCIITAGALLLALPLKGPFALAALLLIGFGCSPVYPSMIQLTPVRFGAENSPRIIGLQMACAYTGSTFVPPLVGLIAANTTMGALPFFLIGYGILMLFMSERINRSVKTPVYELTSPG